MVLPNTAVLVADAAEQVKNMPRYVDFSRPSALTLNELGLSGSVGGNSSGRNSAAQGDDKDQPKGSGTEGSQPKSSSQEESGSDGKRTEDSKTGSSSSKKEEESGSSGSEGSETGSEGGSSESEGSSSGSEKGEDKTDGSGTGEKGESESGTGESETGEDETSGSGTSESEAGGESGSEEEDSSQAGSGTDDSGADGESGDGSDLDSAQKPDSSKDSGTIDDPTEEEKQPPKKEPSSEEQQEETPLEELPPEETLPEEEQPLEEEELRAPEDFYEESEADEPDGELVRFEGSVRTYRTGDGEYTTVIGGYSGLYEREDGTVEEVDDTLIPLKEKREKEEPGEDEPQKASSSNAMPLRSISASSYLANAGGETDIQIPERITSARGIRIESGEDSMELIPSGGSFKRSLCEGNAIRFTDVYENIDYQYTVVGNTVKEDIILLEPSEK